MSNSTTIDARLKIQQANFGAEKLLQSMKHQLEMSLNLSSNLPLVKKIKADLFSHPKRDIKPILKVKISDASSVSTFDSEAGESENVEYVKLSQRDYLSNEEKNVIGKRLENGEKKIKHVLKKLLWFEEACIKKKFVTRKREVEKMREYSKKILNKMLKCWDEFRYQHADSVSLSILYLTAVEVGLSKRKFLEAATEITYRKTLSLEIVKKSMCYSMVKNMLRKE